MATAPSPPRVVAFAGPPGSGKSTLIQAVAARLADAGVLAMDGFPAPAGMAPADLEAWLEAGADFSRLVTPGLAEALGELRAGRAITEPVSGRRVSPAPVVLFEMPLGRSTPDIGPLIDALVWIDTPLDVALARNILAWEAEPQGPPRGWLADYMRHYLAVTRRVLEAQQAVIRPGADLVLDGALAPAELADQVVRMIEARGR